MLRFVLVCRLLVVLICLSCFVIDFDCVFVFGTYLCLVDWFACIA